MKKFIALALSLIMLLGCVSAVAETAAKESITMMGAFSINYDKLPEGYTMKTIENTDMQYYSIITSTDAAKPIIWLSIVFNDAYSEVKTLADVDENTMAAIKDSFYNNGIIEMDDGTIEFEDGKTGLGTPLLIAKAVEGEFGAVYTIYMGHEIELDFFHEGDAKVTEEDFNTVIAFLTDVEFVPAK
jgi:hypothetical protein